MLFTIGILQDPDLYDIPGLPSFWRNVQVEQVDEYTVKFTPPQPFAPFLDYTTIGLLPQHIYADIPAQELAIQPLTQNPIGSGPLQVSAVTAEGGAARRPAASIRAQRHTSPRWSSASIPITSG